MNKNELENKNELDGISEHDLKINLDIIDLALKKNGKNILINFIKENENAYGNSGNIINHIINYIENKDKSLFITSKNNDNKLIICGEYFENFMIIIGFIDDLY
jgi:hypothetical protein